MLPESMIEQSGPSRSQDSRLSDQDSSNPSGKNEQERAEFRSTAIWATLVLSMLGGAAAVDPIIDFIENRQLSLLQDEFKASRQFVSNVLSKILQLHVQSAEYPNNLKEKFPAGYLEQRINDLVANIQSKHSVDELVMIGKPALPFLEDCGCQQSVSSADCKLIYRTIGEIGGNEGVGCLIRVFNQRLYNVSDEDFCAEANKFSAGLGDANADGSASLLKDLFLTASASESPDAILVKELSIVGIGLLERDILVKELTETVLDKSSPHELRELCLHSLIFGGQSNYNHEFVIKEILADRQDPLYKTALSIGIEISSPEILPFFAEIALDVDTPASDKLEAVRVIQSVGAQKYAAALISLLPCNDTRLTNLVIETVIQIGTASDINTLVRHLEQDGKIRENFPIASMLSRLKDSPKLSEVLFPTFETALSQVLCSDGKLFYPIFEERSDAATLLSYLVKIESDDSFNTLYISKKRESLLPHRVEYRGKLARAAIEYCSNAKDLNDSSLDGIGLLASAAPQEMIVALANGKIPSEEVIPAINTLFLMRQPEVTAALIKLQSEPTCPDLTRKYISSASQLDLAPAKNEWQGNLKFWPAVLNVAVEKKIANDKARERNYSKSIDSALNLTIPIKQRIESIERLEKLSPSLEQQLFPLLSDPAEVIRVKVACLLARSEQRKTFSTFQCDEIEAGLRLGLNRYLDSSAFEARLPEYDDKIERAIESWSSPDLIVDMFERLSDDSHRSAAKVRSILNTFFERDENFNLMSEHIERLIATASSDDPRVESLKHRFLLLQETRAIGLTQPFRFSDRVQRAILSDMQPSQYDQREVVVLSFARADHNQAAVHLNNQIEKLVDRGFRVLVMEPSRLNELENLSRKLNNLLEISGKEGACHIFQFGHGETTTLRLGNGLSIDNFIVAKDKRPLPEYSKLLAKGGGVTLLACSTGGQISDEENLLSHFRTDIFPQAGMGEIRAPVLPTSAEAIVIDFSPDRQKINVNFPVQTNSL